jgi:hypothetical protein
MLSAERVEDLAGELKVAAGTLCQPTPTNSV